MSAIRKCKIVMVLCVMPPLIFIGYALFIAINEAISPSSSVITFTFSENILLIIIVLGSYFWWVWLICLVVFVYAATKLYNLRKELKEESNL